MEKLINIQEASEFLAIDPKTLRRDIINKGLIPVVALGKGPKGDRIRPSDLQAFIRGKLCTYSKKREVHSGTRNSKSKANKLDSLLGRSTKTRL